MQNVLCILPPQNGSGARTYRPAALKYFAVDICGIPDESFTRSRYWRRWMVVDPLVAGGLFATVAFLYRQGGIIRDAVFKIPVNLG